MTVEEIRAAIEELWADELQAIEKNEQDAERRADEIQEQAATLGGHIVAGERELDNLRGELARLPERLSVANLGGDDADENSIRSRFNEIEGSLPILGDRIEGHREELEELEDPDTIRHEAAKEAERQRDYLSVRASNEVEELGEALTQRGREAGTYYDLAYGQLPSGTGL